MNFKQRKAGGALPPLASSHCWCISVVVMQNCPKMKGYSTLRYFQCSFFWSCVIIKQQGSDTSEVNISILGLFHRINQCMFVLWAATIQTFNSPAGTEIHFQKGKKTSLSSEIIIHHIPKSKHKKKICKISLCAFISSLHVCDLSSSVSDLKCFLLFLGLKVAMVAVEMFIFLNSL